MVLYVMYRKNKTIILEDQKLPDQVKADVDQKLDDTHTIMMAEVQVISSNNKSEKDQKHDDNEMMNKNQFVRAQTGHCAISMEGPASQCQTVKCAA